MRQFSNQTLESVLAALSPSYKSIDIRALTLTKSGSYDASLACLLLKIRFTKDELRDLEEVYDKPKQNIDPGGLYADCTEGELLKVHLVARSIDEVGGLFDDIRAGVLKIGAVEYRIVSHVEGVSDAEPIWSDGYMISEEYLLYHHLLFYSHADEFLRAYLNREIIDDDAYDFAISNLMDLPSLDVVQANSLLILLPVYCRSLPVVEGERESKLTNYEVHWSLVDHCRVDASKLTGKPTKISIKMKECPVEIEGETKILTIPLSFPILHNDVVEINVLHETLGSISQSRVYGDSILSPPYGNDLLIDAFREFKSNLRFSEYLISNAHETRKVSMQHRLICSSVWLLNMAGYRSIPLGMVDTSDENTICEVHSCDILGCDDARLLVVDCTSTPPPSDKVDRIRNTCSFLRGKLGGREQVIPLIICNDNCIAVKSSAFLAGVVVIDKDDIITMHDYLVNKGLRSEAESYLSNLISPMGRGNPQPYASNDIH